MKKWIALFTILVTGCATQPVSKTEVATPAENNPQEQTKVEPLAAESEIENIDSTAIDPQVMYLLMAAELAGQRNQYAVALEGYLQAARSVNDPRIAERAARIGLFLKDSERTEEAVHLWLAQDAENLTARKIAVLSAFKKADKEQSILQLKALFDLNPAGIESLLQEISKAMAKEGKSQFVFDVLDELLLSYPDKAVLYYMQGKLASSWRDNQLAHQKNAKALALQPKWSKALVFQAQLAGREGKLTEAVEYLQQALKASPDNVRIKKMLAQVYIDDKQYDEAVKVYQGLLATQPEDGESQFAIALLRMQQKEYEQAEADLKKLLMNPAWVAQASYYMGRLEVIRKNQNEALIWFEKVTSGPFQFEANVAAISILIDQSEFDVALSKIDSAELRYPQHAVRLILLKSDLLTKSEDYQAALEVLNEVLMRDADNRDLLYARALVAEKIDRLDVLESDLLKILHINPDDAGALNALGYTLVDKTQRYEEAAVYINKALALKPEEAVIIDSYGWLQFKLGNYAKALENLRKAYEKYPENEIAIHLAEVLWVMGGKEQAKEIINKVAVEAPDNEYLLDFKKRFFQK